MKLQNYLSCAKAQRRKANNQYKNYLGALASLRENKQYLLRAHRPSISSGSANINHFPWLF